MTQDESRDHSIAELDLSPRAYKALLRNGITSIGRLSALSDEELLRFRNLGVKSLEEVRTRLATGLAVPGPSTEPNRSDPVPSRPDLKAILTATKLRERDWDVMLARRGLGVQLTLEETAKPWGLTRERIRQIQARAERRLAGALHAGRLALVLRTLEVGASAKPGDTDPDHLVKWVRRELRREWANADLELSRRVVTTLRSLVAKKQPGFVDKWPNISYRVSIAIPTLAEHPVVEEELRLRHRDSAEARRRWTYAELCESVLDRVGRPMHWRELAREAEALGHRKSFSNSGFMNVLIGHSDDFARVGAGTYALKRWGVEDVPFYPDLIADVLRESGPTTVGDIGHRVNQQRLIKATSLQMFLDLHPRFYRSVNGLYGIREWLGDESAQTLRTPREFVETRESRGRLRRTEPFVGRSGRGETDPS